MGELPPFMRGIPEESITQPKISSEPSRRYFELDAELTRAGVNVFTNMLVVADDEVFEVRYLSITGRTTGVPPGSSDIFFTSSITGGTGNLLMGLKLDHLEHDWINVAPAPLSMLITNPSGIKAIINSSNATAVFTVTGFFIKKSELLQKTNIIV